MNPPRPVQSIICSAMLALATISAQPSPAQSAMSQEPPREWLKQVRIAAYPLSTQNAEAIVRQANESHVYGIEVDNDIPGRYESLLHPQQKLDAIRKLASAAHAQGQKAYVYVAGTECISSNSASPHTVSKDHPQWLQRKLSGQPAIFDTSAAFWIAKGEEDTWISPYAADWRKLYMQRIQQIAATGIDGIYVDIPYWMTHFTGWEDSWASFDAGTLAAFKKQTALDATTQVKLGDFEDPGFRKWIDFRIATITAFLADIRANAIAANPGISIIPEIYPGIEQEAVRVGADVYQLYPVVDAIAHEYEFGAGDDHTAASRPPFDWMMYQIGMRSFRAFAQDKATGDKPTWILNYSWDGAPHVRPSDAMKTLFMSELMAGANVWDAQGHVMSGSNDLATRKIIYQWIADHEDIFGKSRTPIATIGVYFSDTTRNYYPKEFLESYRGTLLMLMQAHRQFQIVTPRMLKNFHGSSLILPNVRIVSVEEATSIQKFAESGGHLILSGQTAASLHNVKGVTRLTDDPARPYLEAAEKNFDSALPDSNSPLLKALPLEDPSARIDVHASPSVVVHAMLIEKKPYLFIANFDGIRAGVDLTPVTQKDVTIEVPASFGTSMHMLPFLGTESVLEGSKQGSRIAYTIPRIDRGAILWFPK